MHAPAAVRRLLYLLALAPGAIAAPAAASLESDLRALIAEERLAGTVYALVSGGRTETGAVGFSDTSTGSPLRADAKVHVGSVAKTLVALAVLRLVSEGRLGLDAPVESLVPDIRFDNPWGARYPVTVRHLLDQTSGLQDLRPWHMFSERTPPDLPLIEVFARSPGVLRLRTEPGRTFSYSNLGYTLAGMVIEAVTGEAYEHWGGRELLAPLGMRDSTFAYTTQTGAGADPRLAWGHLDDVSRVAALPMAVRPAGQFTTTAADMARLAQFLLGDGTVDGRPFIAPQLLRAMGAPVTNESARAGLRAGYALGLAARDRHGALGRCHGSSVVGYRSMFCVYPAQAAAFFVAHNSDREGAGYARFEERLVQALGVSTAAPALSPAPPLAEWTGRYVPMPARFALLALPETLGNTLSIESGADGAALRLGSGEPLAIGAEGGMLLRVAGRHAPSHVLLAPEGRRVVSDGMRSWRRIHPAAYAGLWASLSLGAVALLYWLLWVPVRALRGAGTLLEPGCIGAWLLVVPVPLLWISGWRALGDPTPGNLVLHAVTLALPALMLAQAVRSALLRGRASAAWPADLAASVFALQFCALLFAWEVLPVALWT